MEKPIYSSAADSGHFLFSGPFPSGIVMFYLASNSFRNRRAVVFMKPTIGKNFLAYFFLLCVCVCACTCVCFSSRSWVQTPPYLFLRKLKTCRYIAYICGSSVVLSLKFFL